MSFKIARPVVEVAAWKIIAFLFIGISTASGEQVSNKEDESGVSYSEASPLLSNATLTLEKLHRLKIGDVQSVEASMSKELGIAIIEMRAMLLDPGLLEKDRTRIRRMLVLLAAFQTNHSIAAWRENTEIIDTLDWARVALPECYERFLCYDWSKPMWAKKTTGCD
jgi:hypothetical protein